MRLVVDEDVLRKGAPADVFDERPLFLVGRLPVLFLDRLEDADRSNIRRDLPLRRALPDSIIGGDPVVPRRILLPLRSPLPSPRGLVGLRQRLRLEQDLPLHQLVHHQRDFLQRLHLRQVVLLQLRVRVDC